MIEAITFDFWNTLFKPPPHEQVSARRTRDFRNVLEEEGFTISLDDITSAFKKNWEEVFYYQRAYGRDIGPRGQLTNILKKLGIVPEVEGLEKLYKTYTGTISKIPPELNNGVAETLPVLSEKYKLAVICNTGIAPGTLLREVMRDKGIFNFFEILVFSDEVEFAKPSTKIFKYTLEHLGIKNSAAAHIGDDAITDVIGAKMAGMKAIWLAPGANWAVPEADYHVQNVRELISIF